MSAWGRPVAYDAVVLMAYALYIVVTLLFYRMFKGVSFGLSLLAALLSLSGCAIEVVRVFYPALQEAVSLVFLVPIAC